MPISIHALLAESDRPFRVLIIAVVKFLSTLSLRRATHYDNYNLHCVEISIHALLAESDLNLPSSPIDKNISIHALLAESDHAPSHSPCSRNNFYPRSPCGERHASLFYNNLYQDFYPRSPCGERHGENKKIKVIRIFLSTLSLRRATASVFLIGSRSQFLSTLSLRRATTDMRQRLIEL